MIHFPHEDILFEGKSVMVQKTHANILYRHFHYVFSLSQAYLADYKYEFVPLTYKGKRKHRSVVLELLEKEKQDKLRKELDGTNLVTGKQLIQPGETLDDFIQRNK